MKCKFESRGKCVLTAYAVEMIYLSCDGVTGKEDCPLWNKKREDKDV